MSTKIQTLFEALPSPGCIDELGRLVNLIRDLYDLEHVVYLARSLGGERVIASRAAIGVLQGESGFWQRTGPGLVTVSYSPEWGAQYESEGYDKVDPILAAGPQSFVPIDWKRLDWSHKERRRFLRDAVDGGLGNQGYTVPVRGPDGQFALFTINKSCSDEEWSRYIAEFSSDFLVIAHFYHQKVLEIENVHDGGEIPKISDRERDVLSYLAAGKTRDQVAHDLGISSATIRVYVDSVRHKLGALNVNHAIAIGVRRGIVNPT